MSGLAGVRGGGWPGFALLLCAMLFNMALCFIDTAGWARVGNGQVIACEAVILATGLNAVRREVAGAVPVAGLLLITLVAMKLINPDLDLKIVHDLAIMYIFFKIGEKIDDEAAWSMFIVIICGVIIVAFFEFAFTDLYGKYLNIWKYYVDKGTIGDDVVNYQNSNLFLSAIRGGDLGRNFFPGVFGSHRLSSIFLEPDSLGNFAVIVFAYAMAIPGASARLGFAAAAVVCVVLADSRFASGCCAAMAAVRLARLDRSRLLVFLMPFGAVGLLLAYGAWNALPGVEPRIMSDDLAGRLLFSGRLLDGWRWGEWLGLLPSALYTADTGFAYVFNALGLPMALVLFGLFAARPAPNQQAGIMRAMISVYFATSLCIGASVFTIKTAAILWTLYGALWAGRSMRGRSLGTHPVRAGGVAGGVMLLWVGAAVPAVAQEWVGVNLAGPAFAPQRLPGVYGQDYAYPTAEEVRYFTGKGMTIFRLPILWERLQPVLGGALDAGELGRVSEFITLAKRRHARVILDIHNYGAFRGQMVGAEPFSQLWHLLAQQYGRDEAVVFGLMNEPRTNDAASWMAIVQAAILAIREAGALNTILVPGAGWDAAHRFAAINGPAAALLHDPAGRLVFEAHEYFDTDSSGTHADCIDPAQAVGRFVAMTGWLRAGGRQGFLGEFGASARPECLEAMHQVLAYLRANADVWSGWTYWAAGPRWGEYMFTIEPLGGTDRPQMRVLEPFLRR